MNMPALDISQVENLSPSEIKNIGEENHAQLLRYLNGGVSFAALGRENGTGGQAVKQRLARAARKIIAYNNEQNIAERAEIQKTLDAALSLTDEVREQIGHKNIDDLIRVLKGEASYTSIGKESGITGGSVKDRLDRAQRKINGLISCDSEKSWLYVLKTQYRNVIHFYTDISNIEELKSWVFSEEFEQGKYKGRKIFGLGKIGRAELKKIAVSNLV